MPRQQQVYGKRSRAVYGALPNSSSSSAAGSSPVAPDGVKTGGKKNVDSFATGIAGGNGDTQRSKKELRRKEVDGKKKNDEEEIKVLEVAEELSRLKVVDRAAPDTDKDDDADVGTSYTHSAGVKAIGKAKAKAKERRRALRERSGNAVTAEPDSERVAATGRRQQTSIEEVGIDGQEDRDDAKQTSGEVEREGELAERSRTKANTRKGGVKGDRSTRRPGKDARSLAKADDRTHSTLSAPEESETTNAIPSLPSIRIPPSNTPVTTPMEEDSIRHTSATSHLADSHCSELLSLSNHGITDFAHWSNELSTHFKIGKIAEASFGEVYRLSLLEPLPDFQRSDESVIKVIALKPPPTFQPQVKKGRGQRNKNVRTQTKYQAQEEDMSAPSDVATEVRLLQRMTAIPGFTNFRDVRVVQGRPGQGFIDAFRAFEDDQAKRGKPPSEFPDPADESTYPPEQLWAVIEMQDAGTDLERLVEDGQCRSVWRVWDVFWQAVLALAKGEEGAEFEHRDLHLGNLCIQQHPDYSSISSDGALQSLEREADVPEHRKDTQKQDMQQHKIDISRKLNFSDIKTTLIDYTLSRARMSSHSSRKSLSKSDDSSKNRSDIAYVDLNRDPSLFEADATEEYQYEIYRYMRGAVLLDDPFADFSDPEIVRKAEEACAVKPRDQRDRSNTSGDNRSARDDEDDVSDAQENPDWRSWEQFHPATNLLWLHFILYMLLEQIEWPSEATVKSKGGSRGRRKTKKEAKNGKLDDAVAERANELEKALLRIQELLYPGTICCASEDVDRPAIRAAGDLVGLALSEGWLDVEDVVGEVWEDQDDGKITDDIFVAQQESLEVEKGAKLQEGSAGDAKSKPGRRSKH